MSNTRVYIENFRLYFMNVTNCYVKNTFINMTCANCNGMQDGLWIGETNITCEDINTQLYSTLECTSELVRLNKLVEGYPGSVWPTLLLGIFIGLIVGLAAHNLIIRLLGFAITLIAKKAVIIKASKQPVPRDYWAMKLLNEGQIMALALSIMATTALSCSVISYTSTPYKQCFNDKCEEGQHNVLYMSPGSVACPIDSTVTIHLKMVHLTELYDLSYATCGYSININSTWNCKSSGNCHDDMCGINDDNGLRVEDDEVCSCDATSLAPSDNYFGCFYKRMCVWYCWKALLSGECGNVYKYVRSYYRVYVSVTGPKGSALYAIEQGSRVKTVNDLEISIITISDAPYDSNDIISTGKGSYKVKASNYGSPIPNTIGDIQIGARTYFPDYQIKCGPKGEKVICNSPPSFYKSFMDSREDYEKVNVIYYGNDIAVQNERTPVVGLSIHGLIINGLKSKTIMCDIQVTQTFACKYCAAENYFLLKGSSKSNGLVELTSNCSLSSYKLNCDGGQHKFRYNIFNKFCRIDLVGGNTSFVVANDDVIIAKPGDLHTHAWLSNDVSIVDNVLRDGSFITNLSYTVLGTAMVSALISVLIKLVEVVYIVKSTN